MLRCGTPAPALQHPPLHILDTLLPREPVLNPSQGKSGWEVLGSVLVLRAVLYLDACGSPVLHARDLQSLPQGKILHGKRGSFPHTGAHQGMIHFGQVLLGTQPRAREPG